MAILPTRKAERVGTAREMLQVRNIWRGAPLPTLQVYRAGTRGLVLAHLSFIEDLDDGFEIDRGPAGQVIEPLRHRDQRGSRACVRGGASQSKTVGGGQAEFFGSIGHLSSENVVQRSRLPETGR